MQNQKIKYRHAKFKETMRTGRVGTIHATIKQLKNIFGEPHDCTVEGEWESRDNKTRIEWAFVLNNNKELAITIYDYKNKQSLDEIKRWSLGAKNKKVYIEEFFKERNIEVKIY